VNPWFPRVPPPFGLSESVGERAPAKPARAAEERERDGPARIRTPTGEVGARRARRYTTGPRGTPGWSRTSDLCLRKAVLFRLSYERARCSAGAAADLRGRGSRAGCTKQSRPEIDRFPAGQSLRQESNPHLGRTKGACLPLTLRRQEDTGRIRTAVSTRCRRAPIQPRPRCQSATSARSGDGGNRTRISLGASEERPTRARPRERCGRVESNHHSLRRRGYSPLSSPVLSVRKGLDGSRGGRPESNRYRGAHDPGCSPLHHGHHETPEGRGRPGSNRRPLA
jgi:hypothetical protein